MKDRTVRRLTLLEESASTARVLNLGAVQRRGADDPSLSERPFFQNRILNQSIFIKHRVRANERDLFAKPLATVTKIMAPIDGSDLKLGARFLMLGQRDFDAALGEVFGDQLKPGCRDRQLLDLIDDLPSLDPFLLREHLKRNGFEPARAYFAISDADIQRMYGFVRTEVADLARLSAGGDAQAPARLVERVLSDALDGGSGPLRETLQLNEQEFDDGVFCWRGFLYFKWALSELKLQLGPVARDIAAMQPRGPRLPECSEYLPDARRRLRVRLQEAIEAVERLLAVYDAAYRALTLDGRPTGFREFLLSAPDKLMSLGERAGAVQHIVSFWRYRFPDERAPPAGAEELMDIFLDFEDALASGAPERRLAA